MKIPNLLSKAVKSLFWLIVALIIFALTSEGSAEIVRYVDDQGVTHVVDTSVSKVPARYLFQVSDQLNRDENSDIIEKLREANKARPATFKQIMEANEGDVIEPGQPQEQAEETVKVSAPEAQKPSSPGILNQGNYQIELFVSLECEDCETLKDKLEQNYVNFSLYDVEYSDYARQVYENNGRQVPILRIVSTLIPGYSAVQIDQIIEQLNTGYRIPLYE